MSLKSEIKTLRDSIRMELKEFILARRKLSDKSLTAYVSTLSALYKEVYPESELTIETLPLLEDVDKVLNVINNHPEKYKKVVQKKSVLTALMVASNPELWKPTFDSIASDCKEKLDKQEMTAEQEESWVSKEEIDEVLKKLEKNANLLYKKEVQTPADLQDIQMFIILSLYAGKYFQPRRSQDFIAFKTKNIDKLKDNFLDKGEMVFNSFKGRFVNVRGEVLEKPPQRIPVVPELKKILTKWIKTIGDQEYLLFDVQGKQMNASQLNQRFNKIFGKEKGCGINQMRHTALTEKYGHLIQDNKELAEDMKAMGSSILEAKYYIQSHPVPEPISVIDLSGANGSHPSHNITIGEIIDEPIIVEDLKPKKKVVRKVKKTEEMPVLENMVSNIIIEPEITTPKKVRKPRVKKTEDKKSE